MEDRWSRTHPKLFFCFSTKEYYAYRQHQGWHLCTSCDGVLDVLSVGPINVSGKKTSYDDFMCYWHPPTNRTPQNRCTTSIRWQWPSEKWETRHFDNLQDSVQCYTTIHLDASRWTCYRSGTSSGQLQEHSLAYLAASGFGKKWRFLPFGGRAKNRYMGRLMIHPELMVKSKLASDWLKETYGKREEPVTYIFLATTCVLDHMR